MDATDRQILEFESRFYRHAGAKEQAIRDELGLSAVRYFQRLNGIIEAPAAALALEFGLLIARMRRMRDARQAQRLARPA